ncbi:inner membrane protein YhjD [Stackebrandtia endophytica]|uniref:Inner membrane protein YhjD n=1 Tax=Stackebrandtia endophytica TaxID=1496996 RepID=A0A543AZQ9_9ACTN|nr:YihY/virulence factor BrkB family protein [Stackebrandtia endophytica]TQL77990.1 inner membrane protein YhjD [Stackebrandtia endophytica]
MKFPDVGAAIDRAVDWSRRRSRWFDHFWRAQERFFEVRGGLLSAAIAYYAFFAVLSLSLLALSVLGYLLELQQLYNIVEKWLSENLPIIKADSITASRQTAGLIALTALTVTGVSWVQSIRSSIRAVWLLDPEPGHPIWRIVVDFLVLVGLGLLLIATLTVTAGVEIALNWLSNGAREGPIATAIAYGGTGIGILVNMVLAAALLSGLPRLALPLKRVLPPAFWVAIGLELLKTLGTLYIRHVETRPAYQAVGTAVGLLIFLYVFNQMLLFAASWTATSSRGNVLDLADERRRVDTGVLVRIPPRPELTAAPAVVEAEPEPDPTPDAEPAHDEADVGETEPVTGIAVPDAPKAPEPDDSGARPGDESDDAEGEDEPGANEEPIEPGDREEADEPVDLAEPVANRSRSRPEPLRIWTPGPATPDRVHRSDGES